jgi:hypothetical protein
MELSPMNNDFLDSGFKMRRTGGSYICWRFRLAAQFLLGGLFFGQKGQQFGNTSIYVLGQFNRLK